MPSVRAVSPQTRNNWLVDMAVGAGTLAATLSGIYFLYFPVGGYQGGRNPMYGKTILFSRNTWDDLHTWGGVLMIAVVVIHVALHWKWVVNMAKRIWNESRGKCAGMNWRGHFNVALDTLIGMSFLLTAISGIYFLFVPGGSRGGLAGPNFLFSRTSWDLIHTWAGVLMIMLAAVHFAIHWTWIVKVTRNVLRAARQAHAAGTVPSPVPFPH